MTDEQIEAKKEHAGEKKVSMKRRDGHHDHELHGLRALLEKRLVSTRMPVFCLSS